MLLVLFQFISSERICIVIGCLFFSSILLFNNLHSSVYLKLASAYLLTNSLIFDHCNRWKKVCPINFKALCFAIFFHSIESFTLTIKKNVYDQKKDPANF